MNHEPELLRRTAIQSAAAGLWSCSQLSSHSLFAASRVDSSEEQGIPSVNRQRKELLSESLQVAETLSTPS